MIDPIKSAGLGLLAGLIPVYLGLLPLPLFRRLPEQYRNILVSFSLGILLFLFADVTAEAAGGAKATGWSASLFAVGLILGFTAPNLASWTRRPNSATSNGSHSAPFFTAYSVAFGLGLHNLGEGLALGAAYAGGQFALTSLLLIGFALHNGTEGLGIAGPIAAVPIGAKEPLLLGFLAGSPTILGSLLGAVAYSDVLRVMFFSAASGALLFVIIRLARVIYGMSAGRGVTLGLILGLLAMYYTNLMLSF